MNSPFFRAVALLSVAALSHSAFAQGIGGVTAASRGVTSGVKPSLNTEIPAATTAPPASATQAVRAIPLSPAQQAALQRDYDLFNAANAGETWRIRDLLAKGARIEAADWQYGFTPLIWAAKNGHVGAVRYLLSRGAKINAKSKAGVRLMFPEKLVTTEMENGTLWTQSYLVSESGGITALHAATASGWGMAARELIQRGADVNATNPDGDTALMAAAYHNDLATVKALLAKGAKVDAVDRYGRGALWLAAWRGGESSARALVAAGAKSTPDVNGMWPGDAARLAGNKVIASLLAGREKQEKLARSKGGTSDTGNSSGAPMADPAMTRAGAGRNNGIIILN